MPGRFGAMNAQCRCVSKAGLEFRLVKARQLPPSPASESYLLRSGPAGSSSRVARSFGSLADWSMAAVELHAVFPAGRAAKPAARALAEYLSSTLESESE